MDETAFGIYKVTTGEQVTIKIVATKVGNFSSFVFNGESQPILTKTPRTFQVTATAVEDDPDFGMVQCFFPQDAPDDAKYEVFLQGSVGNTSEITGPDILKTDQPWRVGLEFHV